MNLTLSFGLKELGGMPTPAFETPAKVVKGSHCKFGLIILDCSNRPLTLTSFSTKLRLRKSNDTILEILGTPIDNNKGECEYTLTTSETEELFMGPDQTIEIELFKTATPAITSFHAVTKALTITDKTIK